MFDYMGVGRDGRKDVYDPLTYTQNSVKMQTDIHDVVTLLCEGRNCLSCSPLCSQSPALQVLENEQVLNEYIFRISGFLNGFS